MKKILSLILVFAMMLCLVACNDKDNTDKGNNPPADEKTTYVVTVVDSEGNPIPGVNVTFCPKGGTEFPWNTEADGKATQKSSKEMTARIDKVPTGYEFDKLGQTLEFDSEGKLTVTLTARAPFVVKVVDQDGNPVAGVVVQVCNDSTCVPMGSTDANGEAKRPSMNGSYAAKITELPDGYSVEDIDAYYDLVDGKVTITITKN
jgi:hypothetical protein